MEQHFTYKNNVLSAEGISLSALAEQYGTPLYVYSKAQFQAHYRSYAAACKTHETKELKSLVCYSVKSNSNIAVLNLLGREGSGFDIVSGGELLRVKAAGCDTSKVIFSGVGKTEAEIRLALDAGIACFNAESESEMKRISAIAAAAGKKAPASYRVNPDVDPKTHPYISTGLKENKFGIPIEEAPAAYAAAAKLPGIRIAGISCHIGSQLLDDAPILEALERVLALADRLSGQGIEITHLDLGGGIGITYDDEYPVPVADYMNRVFTRIAKWKKPGQKLTVAFEPGRSISGNAGVLVSEVQYLKENSGKHFAVIDAAMNDLMRPSLYEAWHRILPVRIGGPAKPAVYDVVGPVCESGDWLGKNRELSISEGDLVAIMSAGAYGMSMSSNYNSRGRAAEVMVDGSKSHLIRKREAPEELYKQESVLP